MMLRETRTDKGQWLEEKGKMLKLQMFGIRARMSTISMREEHLVPLNTFIKNKASK
jgi:hypothetical protein